MSNLATIVNNILADSGIDDINVVVTNGSYANPAWITSLAWSKITGAPLGDYLPLSGGTMTGNINWGQTDRGITWGLNTDGAYIKFFNTGDGDPDSRLEYATFDNSDEYHRFMIASNERFTIKNDAARFNNNIVLHAGNYNSYAPTLTGGGASGTWGINVTGSSGSTGTLLLTGLGNGTVNVNNPNTAVYRNENGLGAAVAYAPLLHLGGGDTMWQIQGTYGSSGSGVLYFRQGYNGSWGTWLTMLSSSNYNNYSPTLTGGGASGTWGINISGNADTLDGYHESAFLRYYGYSTSGNFQTFQATPGVLRFDQVGAIDSGSWTNAPTGIYTYGGVLSLRGANFGAQIYISHTGGMVYKGQWNDDNYSGWLRVLDAANFNAYAPTLTGGNASGTWGINITGTAASETLATVVARGNTTGGGRPIVLDNGGGAIITTANAGGWSMGTYYKGSAGTTLAGFGAYGGFDSLTWAWIGPGYEAPWMTINSGTATFNTAVNINGIWQTNISTTGGWSKLSFVASSAWGDGVTYGVLGAGGGNEPGVMTYNQHAVWVSAGQGAGVRMGRSGGVASGAWYQVATMASDEFMIAKNGAWSNGGIKILSNGAVNYGNTGYRFVHNNGTWDISINGNAATATSATSATSSTYSTYLTSNNASVGNGFASWNSYDDTTNNPANSWWYGMRVSHGDALSYYSFSIGANFFTNEVYYRRIAGGTSQGWVKFLDSGNYNSYSPTLTGGGASGTWGINVTGNSATTNQLNFGGGTVMNNSAWAGTGGYHGYTYSGGNFRFGFSSTSGVVDVYADGNFYATDNSYLVLHTGNSPYAYNMNQYVRTTDAVSFASTGSTTFYNGRYTEWWCGDAVAPGPGANRYEVGRIGIDFNDWNGVGTFEVELQEIYFYAGGRKRYVISYGYGGPVISCNLVELNGFASQGNFRVVVGPEVVVSGDWRYLPVFVEVQYYTQVAIKVRTTRNITNSNVPEVGYAKIFTSPSGTGIGGFSVDTTVYPTSGQADISNPIMRATSYLVTPLIYSGGGNVTFGNNIGLDGNNAQIQFNAAASSDLYLSCIPGTRTVQIRNGNSGSPNYAACGLYTGYASFYNNVKIYPQGESWGEGLAFIMPTTSTWGGLRWQRQRAGNDGNWYIGYTALDSSDDLVFGSNNGGSQVNNIMRMTKSGPVSFVSTITASAFYESSDRRIKDLIQDNYRVSDIETIRPKLYKKNGKIELGYYAQDVQPILSHAVSANEDGFLNLSYREVHTAKIAYLEDSIEEIKAKILYLENQLKTKQ